MEKGRGSSEAGVTTQQPDSMTNSTHLYGQLFDFLRQYSHAQDLRHLKALAWMVSRPLALIPFHQIFGLLVSPTPQEKMIFVGWASCPSYRHFQDRSNVK